MKRIFLSLLLNLIAMLPAANGQQKIGFRLEEAIATALVNNYGQQILEVSRLSAEEEFVQSKRDLLPDLTGSLSQTLSNQSSTGAYSLNTSAVIWRQNALSIPPPQAVTCSNLAPISNIMS